MNIIVFGAGLFYQHRKEQLQKYNIVAFIDNDMNKQGTTLDGIRIIPPSEIYAEQYDNIVLMSKYGANMRKQLLELGIDNNKIIDYVEKSQVPSSTNATVYYREGIKINNKGLRILLISHELSLTGAPIVLYYMALLLKQNGHLPVILCPSGGELEESIVSSQIAVIIEKNIHSSNWLLWEWIKSYDIIIVNTLVFSYLMDEFRQMPIPILWWLHEGNDIYKLIADQNLPRKISKNIYVYAVGNRAIEAYKDNIGNKEVLELLYGIPDLYKEKQNYITTLHRKKIIFATIGSITHRKAQDILLDAIKLLTLKEREQAEFWIIGDKIEQDYYNRIASLTRELPEVKLTGQLNRLKMQETYQNIDVIVCPSRIDPMPVVLTEAMMLKKVLIVSDRTGTADIITHQKNGLICRFEDAVDLACQIRWIINHRDNMVRIGNEARNLYEKYFSMETFSHNIMKIINKISG